MEVGKWYRVIDISDPPHTPIAIGDYWQFEKDDGSSMPYFRSTKNIGHYLKKSRFDPTPHTRTTFPNMPDLLERVSKIDPAAAEWLEFGDHSNTVFNSDARSFEGVHMWCSSKQGSDYWNNINKILNQQTKQRSTPMQKEYEYEATGISDIMPGDISKFKPCDTEFGKAVKWYYDSKGDEITDTEIVSLLVKEQRFSWLNWLSENTPFVKRTEKKAFKFGPENLRLEYAADGSAKLIMNCTDEQFPYEVLQFYPSCCNPVKIITGCANLPVQMDGDKIAIK